MFNTKNPLEFLALWWALISKQVMPEVDIDSPSYRNCVFVLKDKKQSTSTRQDKEFERTIASSTVMTIVMGKNNKAEENHLQNIFKYVGLDLPIKDLEPKPLISSFNSWSENGSFNNENSTIFNETYKKFKEEKNRDELVVYVKLLSDIKEGKVKVERRDIIVAGKNLGSDKKHAARKIVADQELLKEFIEL